MREFGGLFERIASVTASISECYRVGFRALRLQQNKTDIGAQVARRWFGMMGGAACCRPTRGLIDQVACRKLEAEPSFAESQLLPHLRTVAAS